jgi:hypothetical protein
MIGSDQVVYSVTNKITYRQNDFLICSYDLSFVCFEEFVLQFNITERDALSQMKNMSNANETAMIKYDDLETQKGTKRKMIKFDSKRGLFWYVNITVITCTDGSFCVFDKSSIDKNLTTITPVHQTHKQFSTIIKNCSLTKSTMDGRVFWLFLSPENASNIIGSTRVCFEAYTSPPSPNFIANNKLTMLTDVSYSVQSKKHTPIHVNIN